MDRRPDLGTGNPVDRGMMDLRNQGKTAFRNARHVVEALDDIGLPKRSRRIERPGMQACRLDAELTPVTGLRERDVADVKLEIEVRVVDPVRVIQA